MKADGVAVGCCGFPVARPRYYRHFSLVEVQRTFYQPPRLETLQRWRDEAPEGFQFTLKAWQLITHPPSSPTYRRLKHPIPAAHRDRYGHFRPTEEVWAAWETTLACARRLQARVILFQCPPSFVPDDTHIAWMRHFFRRIDLPRLGLQGAWEPRGPWPRPLVARLCAQLDLWPVVDPSVQAPYPGAPRYFRLHGGPHYAGRYDDEALQRLRRLLRPGDYCLFNNRHMFEDARRLLQLLQHEASHA